MIVKLSSIGDVVHTLPAVALLRRSLPDAHISWVVEERAAEILKCSPAIDELIEINSRAWRRWPLRAPTLSSIRSTIRHLRNQYDLAIDFQGLMKSGAVAWLSNAPLRIGCETSELREKPSRAFLNRQVTTSQFEHVIEKNLMLARAALHHSGRVEPAGVDAGRYDFPISVSDEDLRYVSARVREIGGRFAILNPGGGWPTKLWSAESYARLADTLWREYSLPSFVTYGPGEEALAANVAAMARSDAARPLASTIKQFFALAQRALLFVGGDTGPLHIAAAAGASIIGIYGPTASERNGPFNANDTAIGRDLWCRQDCHRRTCWHWECLRIPVELVADAVRNRLSDSKAETSHPR